jgi:uncharacterized protein YecE (DUF72 family)
MPSSPHPVRIGCSGWSYPDWRGRFYPQGVPQRAWLAYYAERFGTVEVNNTFYRLPKRSMAEQWDAQTPAGFLFTIKVSRYLTHIKRLLPAKGGGVERLLEPLQPLVESGKLGPLLWQLPPDFERDDERLAGALDRAPRCRNAIEFRHPSWFTPDVYSLLAERDAALVVGDDPERPFQPRRLTAGWTLIRLHRGSRGRGGRYSEAELDTWRRRIAQWRRRAEVLAYFNNDTRAHAVANARHLASSFEPSPSRGKRTGITERTR